MPSKPSKPSPKRRPRVAGMRPGGRRDPSPARPGQPAGPELPEEIASAASIERGEPDPAAGLPEATPTAPRRSPEVPTAGNEHTARDPAGGSPATDAPAEQAAVPDGGEEATGRRRPRKLAVVFTVAALVLGGFAAFAALRWGGAAQTSGNRALTDAGTTKQVTTQVDGALNTLLAFDYKHPRQHDKAARRLIDGKLADCSGPASDVGYQQLMDVLRTKGPKAKLTLKSTVLKSGVQQLRGDRAQLLVLLDQRYSKGTGTNAQKSSALAAAVVHAIHKDGRWQLTALCLQ